MTLKLVAHHLPGRIRYMILFEDGLILTSGSYKNRDREEYKEDIAFRAPKEVHDNVINKFRQVIDNHGR